jgi:hypothetical protein
MSNKWNIGEPGGPSGPFYSIVSEKGRVIALMIPSRKEAEEIVEYHNDTVEWERADKAEIEATKNLTTEQADAILREYGFDTVEIGKKTKALVRVIYENYQLRAKLERKDGAEYLACVQAAEIQKTEILRLQGELAAMTAERDAAKDQPMVREYQLHEEREMAEKRIHELEAAK